MRRRPEAVRARNMDLSVSGDSAAQRTVARGSKPCLCAQASDFASVEMNTSYKTSGSALRHDEIVEARREVIKASQIGAEQHSE